MMERVVTAVRWMQRAEARLSDSIIGDLIGALCLMIGLYGALIAGAVLV